MTAHLHHGDCRTVLATLPAASVDAVVTDPPYELGFMGKRWDATGIAYDVAMWAEVLRVLKPGGHLLAFGGTRTYHRMACAIEDAGFEIRDSIHWLYGSGFPKSLDVSKAIDKRGGNAHLAKQIGAALKAARQSRNIGITEADRRYCGGVTLWSWYEGRPAGQQMPTAAVMRAIAADWPEMQPYANLIDEAEREVVGTKTSGIANRDEGPRHTIGASKAVDVDITAPATDAAREWDGWGTALKPAHEPIVVARKPLNGTVAANVLEHGTGALNVDGCRVGSESTQRTRTPGSFGRINDDGWMPTPGINGSTLGRWPANVVLSHGATCGDQCAPGCPIAAIDQQADGAARFFTHADLDPLTDLPFAYVAKPSRSERNAGLDELPKQQGGGMSARVNGSLDGKPTTPAANHHPTVKPLALMRWLVRLVTPPDGTVLDPFAGSGTTLAAAILEHRHTIGIELTADYLPIINGRITWAQQQAHHDRHRPHQETLDL